MGRSSSPQPQQAQSGSKPRRRRGPTSQQKVAELERLVAEQTAMLQRLSMDNAFMSERVRMLELVIKTRDEQLTRIQAIQDGLDHNPFESIGSSTEEMRQAPPSLVVNHFMRICGEFAVRLSPLLPLLEQQPELVLGPGPGARWEAVLAQGDAKARSELLPPHLHVDATAMQDLISLVQDAQRMFQMLRYAFFVSPQILLASSLHVHAVDPGQHTSWQALAALIKDIPEEPKQQLAADAEVVSKAKQQQSQEQASRGGGGGGAAAARGNEVSKDGEVPQLPPVAPETHWRDVIEHVHLSEQQRLQAAVLRSIISRPLAEIRRHRAHLGSLFAQLHPGVGPPTPPHESPMSPSQSSGDTTGGPPSGDPLPSRQQEGQQAQHERQLSGESAHSERSGGAAGSGVLRLPRVQWDTAASLQQEAALLKRLQQTVVKEMCLVALVTEVLLWHVFTPVQMALVLINSWPYFPDDLAMLNTAGDLYNPTQQNQAP